MPDVLALVGVFVVWAVAAWWFIDGYDRYSWRKYNRERPTPRPPTSDPGSDRLGR